MQASKQLKRSRLKGLRIRSGHAARLVCSYPATSRLSLAKLSKVRRLDKE
jgi:hypothetical protein